MREEKGMAPIGWLFVAAMPNSGTTALARLLETAPAAATIGPRGEGFWLVPELAAFERRWDPETPADFERAAATWREAAAFLAPRPQVILEKSPPNLCRMRAILAAFQDEPARLVRYVRDPLAICAAWSRRYAHTLVERWQPGAYCEIATQRDYFTALGRICGLRFQMLRDLANVAELTLRYEDFAADPATGVRKLAALYPALGEADPHAAVAVKDYPPGAFANFNAAQTALLDKAQIAWTLEGLAPFGDACAAFGYDVYD